MKHFDFLKMLHFTPRFIHSQGVLEVVWFSPPGNFWLRGASSCNLGRRCVGDRERQTIQWAGGGAGDHETK